MAKPVVAIVGRPNVGKSTLFNRIAGRRIAIIEDTPGVTRDRIYADCEWITKHFSLIDTGGIEPDSDDIILSQMRTQAELAIDTADVILFIVDGKNGMTATDREIGDMLRKSKKKVILVCNKIDKFVNENNIYEFYELGFEEVVSISASEGLGIGDLLDDIIAKFGEAPEEEIDEDEIRIAVIGKPNAGKSSIINKMIGEGRVIVSNIPGTTRDSIDTNFEKDNQKYVLIDTAGIRRKSKVYENIERYSVIRALRSIERADVCLLIIDAENGVTEQDTKISGYAHENGKAIIIVINKWDLVEKDNKTHKDYLEDVVKKLSFITYAPILTVSALTGQRVHNIFKTVKEVSDYSKFRISTGVLNDIIAEAVLMNQPRSVKGKRLKILYALQASVKPPKFVIFVNNKELVHFSYKRYLENKIRDSFIFKGTPIILEFRNRGS